MNTRTARKGHRTTRLDASYSFCCKPLAGIMPLKRTSTSEAPAITQAAIRKLVADSVSAALEAQAATMANADNTNRNTEKEKLL
ncbi:hypothetical protein Tco_1180929 [Tanacetum coccineum]